MARAKPKVTIRKPTRAPSESSIRELEERAEARQAAPAGDRTASSQARKPAAKSAASLSVQNGADADRARGSWTKDQPYVRRDGVATRGTTVYLPVDTAERLRQIAFKLGRKQSEIIAESLEGWLSKHGG